MCVRIRLLFVTRKNQSADCLWPHCVKTRGWCICPNCAECAYMCDFFCFFYTTLVNLELEVCIRVLMCMCVCCNDVHDHVCVSVCLRVCVCVWFWEQNVRLRHFSLSQGLKVYRGREMRVTLSSTLLHQASESACLFLRIYVLECVRWEERQKEADTDRPYLIMTHFTSENITLNNSMWLCLCLPYCDTIFDLELPPCFFMPLNTNQVAVYIYLRPDSYKRG